MTAYRTKRLLQLKDYCMREDHVLSPPHLVDEALQVLLMALRTIAESGAPEDPGDGNWEGSAERAFGCGLDATYFEMAQIARDAIAKIGCRP